MLLYVANSLMKLSFLRLTTWDGYAWPYCMYPYKGSRGRPDRQDSNGAVRMHTVPALVVGEGQGPGTPLHKLGEASSGSIALPMTLPTTPYMLPGVDQELISFF